MAALSISTWRSPSRSRVVARRRCAVFVRARVEGVESLLEGIHSALIHDSEMTLRAWRAWHDGDGLRAKAGAALAVLSQRGASAAVDVPIDVLTTGPVNAARVYIARMTDVTTKAGHATSLVLQKFDADAPAHVWVLPHGDCDVRHENAMVALLQPCAPGLPAARVALARVHHHVACRLEELDTRARRMNRYDFFSLERAKKAPIYGALLSADGESVRLFRGGCGAERSMGSWPPPLSSITWTRPLPLKKEDGVEAVPGGFSALARLLAAEPGLLRAPLRVPDRVIWIAAAEAELQQKQRSFDTEYEASSLRADISSSLRADISSLRADISSLRADMSSLRADIIESALRLLPDAAGGADPDAILGKGAHSVVYALPRRAFGGASAVAKVDYNLTAELSIEAAMMRRLAAANVPFAQRLLHEGMANVPRSSSFRYSRMLGQAPFLVHSPRGVSLTSLLDSPFSPFTSREARERLAEGVTADLLAMLRGAHNDARLVHGNIKPPNIILAPRAPLLDGEADLQPASVDARTHYAVLVDWANPADVGGPLTKRWQRGFASDEAELWLSGECSMPPAAAVQDLESVAYLYAAIREGAALRGHPRASEPPWMPAPGDWDEQEWLELAREAVLDGEPAGTPLAVQRNEWLRQHPEALGDRGRRFLELVRSGHAVYSLDDA